MQKPLPISQCLNTSVLLQHLSIYLSITSTCMQRVIFLSNSSLSILCQIKYQEPGIIHTFVHGFLTALANIRCKTKTLVSSLVARDFHYESILAGIMPDRNGNSVVIIAVTRAKFLAPV